jgi:hypothetical protein
MVRFARLINGASAPSGGPSAGDAFGGNLSLTCLPPSVMPSTHAA